MDWPRRRGMVTTIAAYISDTPERVILRFNKCTPSAKIIQRSNKEAANLAWLVNQELTIGSNPTLLIAESSNGWIARVTYQVMNQNNAPTPNPTTNAPTQGPTNAPTTNAPTTTAPTTMQPTTDYPTTVTKRRDNPF